MKEIFPNARKIIYINNKVKAVGVSGRSWKADRSTVPRSFSFVILFLFHNCAVTVLVFYSEKTKKTTFLFEDQVFSLAQNDLE